MKPIDFFAVLQRAESPSKIKFSVTNFSVNVDWHDAFAAHLLMMIHDNLGDAKFEDVDRIVDCMKFWSTFWASMPIEDDAQQMDMADIPHATEPTE